MVSDFITERDGYLALTTEELRRAQQVDHTIRMCARQQLEYVEAKEGYWTSESFLQHIKRAVKITEIKYLREQGWRLVWLFDHSNSTQPCQRLDVLKMNVNSGGKRVMRDGWWNGKI